MSRYIYFFQSFLSKVALSLGGRALSLLMIKMGCSGGLLITALITYFHPEPIIFMMDPSGGKVTPYSGPSGPSSSSSWTEDSFEIRVLLEPFSETETEGTSVNPPIPRVAGEEGGPSHQTAITPNGSWESSLRTRIRLL